MTATRFGIIAGVIAVSLEFLFRVSPPSGYGICMACHGRDVLVWITNEADLTSFSIADASLIFPLLTVPGVLIGAWLAASRNGEFRWHKPASGPGNLLLGFGIMIFALIAAGCTFRLTIRAAYGEPLGIFALAALVAGILGATVLMRRWALR
jgi:hypothetical protein